MKLDLTGLHIEVTDAIKEFTEKKVQKLAKFVDDNTICHVTFTEKSKGKQHLDIRIEYKSHTFIAEKEVEDIYSEMDDLVSKIESQIKKEKSIDESIRKDGHHKETEEDENIEKLLEE